MDVGLVVWIGLDDHNNDDSRSENVSIHLARCLREETMMLCSVRALSLRHLRTWLPVFCSLFWSYDHDDVLDLCSSLPEKSRSSRWRLPSVETIQAVLLYLIYGRTVYGYSSA